MGSFGWAVSAAILLGERAPISIRNLAERVMGTGLCRLGVKNVKGVPHQTLRTQLTERCPHTELFSVADGQVELVGRRAASQDVEVKNVLAVLSARNPMPQLEPLAAPTAVWPAGRVDATVSRIVRDTQLTAQVKALHNYECQLCKHTITLPDGSRYAEGHHIQPLGSPHDGPDIAGNILCLCPNHHAACDLGAISLEVDELRRADGHIVGQQFLDYHNRHLYRAGVRAEPSSAAGPATGCRC